MERVREVVREDYREKKGEGGDGGYYWYAL